MKQPVDPITLEVLRHRLWVINDEQGKVATQISGSPVVYESYDFNSSLMTPQGDSLFVGVYTTRLSLSLHMAAKYIIKNMAPNPGFQDGDAFVTNDPWAGASHMNDFLMVAPIFWQDEIVAWSGIAMHEMDVGGPVPGSFSVGAKEVYGEGPLIPPVKLVERGQLRKDIEQLVVRNSRTPELNALDIRARLAAINRTRERIGEIIAEYGVATFLSAQEHIMELARRGLARRLEELPDGTWCEEGFMDHDGNENRLYPLKLAMTKKGGRLTLDFTGTSPQARGIINCTRVGLEGGIMSAVLSMLCYDMPWCPGGLMDVIDIISEEGTINNARHPAAVSMATVAAAFATSNLVASAIAKMCACSQKYREEAQANWSNWQGMAIAGIKEGGAPFTGTLLDEAPGSGARSYKDGMDTGGLPGSPCMAIANVETCERLYPILYIYRRQARDTGGPGKYRGGSGTELLMIPHRSDGPIDVTVLSQGGSHPDPRGLYGGYPASVQVRLHLRQTDIEEKLASSIIPTEQEHFSCRELVALEAKDRISLSRGDAMLMISAGGGGYGDPLERDPQLVLDDLRRSLCSPQVARDVYGVVMDEGGIEFLPGPTQEHRHRLRELRLHRGQGSGQGSKPLIAGPGMEKVLSIGECLDVLRLEGNHHFACQRCGYVYGEVQDNPKLRAVLREGPIT
ncbi:MAG: hydantoinase B/oxoprolinase family protein, partial [Dehalococcoidia bacterium]